jgi:hypothetical protein
MTSPIKECLELAKANIGVGVQHFDEHPEVTYQHIQRAIKELKDVEYELWRRFAVSGVPQRSMT